MSDLLQGVGTSGIKIFAREAMHDEFALAAFVEAARHEASLYRGNMNFVPSAMNDESLCVVGGAGVTVFGVLRAHEVSHQSWFIDLLHVSREARGIGIGSAMLSTAIGIVKQRGGTRLNAAALPGDRSTKNLFERHGLVAQMITVGKDL
jgi:GNAT superfamily N-acetyltransferase